MSRMTERPKFVIGYGQNILIDLYMYGDEYDDTKIYCSNYNMVRAIKRLKTAQRFNDKMKLRIETISKRVEYMLKLGEAVKNKYKFPNDAMRYKFEDDYEFLMTQIYAEIREVRKMVIDEEAIL